ncbi:40S ribosomal protein S4, X isoform, partial [Podila humilis]
MSSLPIFSFSCVAPDTSGNPYLFGVSSPGRLEVHSLDLSNALAPSSKLISATSTPSGWDPQANLGCYSYTSTSPSTTSSPISVLQFGTINNSPQTLFYPSNGTWASPVESATGAALSYQGPKLFSLVGSAEGWSWFVARAALKAGGALSWRGIRFGPRMDAGPQDLMPGYEPLFTVGAIAQEIGGAGNGFLFAFEQSGSAGRVYRTIGNKLPDSNVTAAQSMLTLSKPSAINMNNLTVTHEAIPVTSGFSAFVVDKSPAGLVSIMTIDPRNFNYKLTQAPVNGKVPNFLTGQSAASINSQIVIYGGQSSAGPSNDIHIFNIISGTWSGPALVTVPAENGSSAVGPNAAIIGGAAAGAALLIAIIGFLLCRSRRSSKQLPSRDTAPLEAENRDNKLAMIDMLSMEAKSCSTPRIPHHPSTPGPQAVRSYTADSNTTLTQTDPVVPANHPYSQSRSQGVSQHSTKSKSRRMISRQPSAYSVYSDGAASHISLFPIQSGNVYLVDSPSLMPPTPIVPSAYTNNTIKSPHLTLVAVTPSTVESPNIKGTVYNVAVRDDYDDRRPLQRQGTTEDNRTYQHMASSQSSTGSPSGSWSGQSDSQPVLPAETITDRPSRSQQRSSQSTLSQSTSQPMSPSRSSFDVPQTPTSALHSKQSVQSSKPSKTRRKRPSTSTASRLSPADNAPPGTSTLLPPPTSFDRNEQRDSHAYKVEYKEQSINDGSTSASRGRRQVPSPTVSESDRTFVNVFPLPSVSTTTSESRRATKAAPSPTPYETNREQQELWRERQIAQQEEQHLQKQLHHQHQRQRQQRQHGQEEDSEGDVGKTPKLASLPRPVARGPKKHLKRLNAPKHWMLDKLTGTYAPRPTAGPHKLRECLPLIILIRNRLKYALNGKEVQSILMQRLVKVDGKVRTDSTFPAGFMDAITIEKTGENFRLVYDTKGRFTVHRITAEEAQYKLCKVKKVQLGAKGIPFVVTHDGRTLRYPDPLIKVNDTIKLDLESGKFNEFIKFEVGNVAMV